AVRLKRPPCPGTYGGRDRAAVDEDDEGPAGLWRIARGKIEVELQRGPADLLGGEPLRDANPVHPRHAVNERPGRVIRGRGAAREGGQEKRVRRRGPETVHVESPVRRLLVRGSGTIDKNTRSPGQGQEMRPGLIRPERPGWPRRG